MILVLVFLFVALNFWIKARSFLDPDFGWHLRMGEIIRTQGIPQTDPFSYTMPSYPVIGHEWLTDIGLALLYRTVGLDGMSIFFAVLALIAIGISFWFSHPKWRLLPFLLAALSFIPFLGIRPQVLSWVLFSVLLVVVLHEKFWKKFRWFLPLFMLLWTNLHGSFPLGLFVIILAVITKSKFEYRNSKSETNSNDKKTKYKNVLNLKNLYFSIVSYFVLRISDLIIVALCFLATIINPYGWRIWLEVWSSISDSSLRWAIQEWLPAPFLFNLPFLVLLPISVLLVWKYRKQFQPINLAVYSILLLMGLSSSRHVPFWLLIALPMTSQGLQWLYEEVVKIKHGKERLAVVYKVLIVGIAIIVGIDFILMLPQAKFSHLSRSPHQAVAYLKSHPSSGNIFNEYGLGGYLIWQYPEKKVFIDGRMPSWRWEEAPKGESKNVFAEYEIVMNGKPATKELLRKYKVDTVILLTQEDPENLARIVRKLSPLRLVNKPKLREQLNKMGMKEVYRDGLVVIYRVEK